MAMAFKCDRCGAYFTANDAFWKADGKPTFVSGLYKYDYVGNRKNIDICPKCYESLKEWMKEGENSQGDMA